MEAKELVEFLEGKALQLRRHILEMVGVGKAGHLGGSSSCAEIVAALYFHWMKIDPENQHDPERTDSFKQGACSACSVCCIG